MIRFKIILLALLLLLTSSAAFGANIHIDPSLADPNTGEDGTFANPYNSWTDITFSASDDYYQKCDTTETISATLTVSVSGTSGDNVIIGSYYGVGSPTYGVSGARPIIIRSDELGNVVRLTGDYIYIKNMDIRRAESALRIDGDYCTAENNYAGGGSNIRGIYVWGDYATVFDNFVDSMHDVYGQLSDGPNGDGFNTTQSSSYITAYGNTIDSWGHQNIQIQGDYGEYYDNLTTNTDSVGGSAIGFGYNADNNIVHHNYFLDQGDYSQVGGGSYNVIHNNKWVGHCTTGSCDFGSTTLHAFQFTAQSGDDIGNVFSNNVLYNASSGRGINFYWATGWGTISGNEVTNNIIYVTGDDRAITVNSTGIGAEIFYNNQMYYSGGTAVVMYRGGEISISSFNSQTSDTVDGNQLGDPLFTNVGSNDFTLQSGSPCRNAGRAITDEGIDLGWNPSSSNPPSTVTTTSQTAQGAAPEIGPYVYLESDATPPVISNPDPSEGQILTAGTTTYDMEIDCTDDSNCTGCKADTDGGESYAAMANAMVKQSGTTTSVWRHSLSGLTDDSSYTWYFRCTDGTNPNTSDFTLNFSVAPESTGTIIIDNLDAGFTEETGTWGQSTATSGFYSVDYTTNKRVHTAVARFTFTIYDAGSYRVQMYWSSNAYRHPTAPVTITHAGGTYQTTVDQTTNGDQFNNVITLDFEADTYYLELGPEAEYSGYYICADAIKLVKIVPSGGGANAATVGRGIIYPGGKGWATPRQ